MKDEEMPITLNLDEIIKLDSLLEFFGTDAACRDVRDHISQVLVSSGINQIDGLWSITGDSRLIKKSIGMQITELLAVWELVDQQVKFRGSAERILPTIFHKLSFALERQGFIRASEGWLKRQENQDE